MNKILLLLSVIAFVSGYVLDFNRKNAGRFQDTHWTEWYGTPYKTNTLNIHTTKYLPQ